MTLNHVHFQVQDLRAAVDWFTTVLEVRRGFENDRIATFIFGTVTVIIDGAPADSPATLGFESDDCDRDFQIVVQRCAVSIEAPVDKELGCENGLFQGAGGIDMRDRGAGCQ
jgi:catechol 2,3-dioxygenase-like lactoylglutathione lyase family enzyme